MTSTKTILAGMRPTNFLHLGNYLGSAKGMIELQNRSDTETFYMIVDLHAITTPYSRESMRSNVYALLLDYLACGLNPDKSAIFVQSMVKEHAVLSSLLSSVVTIARMQHLPTFKEKVKQYPQHTTMALLNYPVLMAADILAYKASLVPAGVDQEPHLEVAREIARKMNAEYGTDFPEPQRFETAGSYIPSLMGEGKMSKSVEGSYIRLVDDLETIQRALAKVPTDSGKGSKIELGTGVSALLTLVEHFEGSTKRSYYEDLYTTSGIKYQALKTELATAIYEHLLPIQERRKALEPKKDLLQDILVHGAKLASVRSAQTLGYVFDKMGFSYL